MQCSNQNNTQRDRALFYGGKLVSESLAKGETYDKMKKSYQITVTNYREFDDDDFFTEFQMFSIKKEIVLSNKEKIYFIELPKLKKYLKSDFENITPLQFWAIMIKYSQNREIREKLRETSKYKEDTAMADAVMTRITDDMRAWAVKLSREGGEIDRLTNLAAAEKRGENRGRAEGLSIGRAQGREEGLSVGRAEGLHAAKLEDARNGLNLGLSIEQIQILTGLSVSEIEDLQ